MMRRRLLDITRRVMLRVAVPPPRLKGMIRLGSADCGWYVPSRKIDETWVCYTAGVGEDASFDVALAQRGCDVVAIDPTPRALAHIAPFVAANDGLRIAPYAVWTEETEVRFFPPADPRHVSFSVGNLQGTIDPIKVAARPLPLIMREFGHQRVDLLKLDIEGAEYEVLPTLDFAKLGVRVVCVEYHFGTAGVFGMIREIRSMQSRGFRLGFRHLTDVTFLR